MPECDSCGCCCRFPIISIEWEDIQREPRWREKVEPRRAMRGDTFADPYEAGAVIACGSKNPCPMLDGNLCSIHATKPDVCRGFEPGSELCQEARRYHGLSELV